jgi:hypothetical protein
MIMSLYSHLRESNSSHHSWWELGISNDPGVFKTSRHFLPCLHTLLAPTALKNYFNYFYYFLLTIINGFVKSDETKNGGNNDNNENQW